MFGLPLLPSSVSFIFPLDFFFLFLSLKFSFRPHSVTADDNRAVDFLIFCRIHDTRNIFAVHAHTTKENFKGKPLQPQYERRCRKLWRQRKLLLKRPFLLLLLLLSSALLCLFCGDRVLRHTLAYCWYCGAEINSNMCVVCHSHINAVHRIHVYLSQTSALSQIENNLSCDDVNPIK